MRRLSETFLLFSMELTQIHSCEMKKDEGDVENIHYVCVFVFVFVFVFVEQ